MVRPAVRYRFMVNRVLRAIETDDAIHRQTSTQIGSRAFRLYLADRESYVVGMIGRVARATLHTDPAVTKAEYRMCRHASFSFTHAVRLERERRSAARPASSSSPSSMPALPWALAAP